MILVVGATGMLGGMITQQLLAQGKEVRILVRENSPSEALATQGRATAARTLVDAGAQPVYGDMKDRGSLDRAMIGMDTMFTTANSALRGGEDNPETVECQGNRCLIDAAKAAGVKHLIFTSMLGAETVQGDLRDPASLARACLARTHSHKISTPGRRIEERGSRIPIEAAQVDRIACLPRKGGEPERSLQFCENLLRH